METDVTTTQPAPTRPSTPTLGAITHVALTVRDIDVSVPWYTALIGAPPVLDEDTGPFRHAVFALGGTLLGLHSFPEGIDELEFSPRRPGIDHLAFAAHDRSELVAWERRLTEMVVPHGDIVDAPYGSGLSFKDPDGLPLEIFCPPAA
jgi:catechol 2,3-dioxygenase-like lactoylglutathione lyase family enzyme